MIRLQKAGCPIDQKMKISSIVQRYSNINDLWDLMSVANKVLKCKNQGLHESHIDWSRFFS